jgi:hypothetical protein
LHPIINLSSTFETTLIITASLSYGSSFNGAILPQIPSSFERILKQTSALPFTSESLKAFDSLFAPQTIYALLLCFLMQIKFPNEESPKQVDYYRQICARPSLSQAVVVDFSNFRFKFRVPVRKNRWLWLNRNGQPVSATRKKL